MIGILGLLGGLASVAGAAATAAASVTVAIWGVVAAVAPIILSALFSVLAWAWTTIFWPGLKHILEDWVTVVTVGVLGAFLWFGFIVQSQVFIGKSTRDLNQCRVQLAQVRKQRPPAPEPEPQFQLPFPFSIFKQ